ncbi:hypothetical protein HHI36_017564 [Cryptolaemus montrouzieri]|uniref:Uncharacterized protein n=1 Tax=Cryptolaemus montrouzieri TaxID=559131 RepID=A0ABD2NMX2_9CUCU
MLPWGTPVLIPSKFDLILTPLLSTSTYCELPDSRISESTQSKALDKSRKTKSPNFYGDKIHDFEIELFDQKIKEVETLKKENAKIMDDMNALQQQMKMNEIDLIGIPEKKNENICDIIKDLATSNELSLN